MLNRLKTSTTLQGTIAVFLAANILVWFNKIDANAWWLAISLVFNGYFLKETRVKINDKSNS